MKLQTLTSFIHDLLTRTIIEALKVKSKIAISVDFKKGGEKPEIL
jgi:hypothetical protein